MLYNEDVLIQPKFLQKSYHVNIREIMSKRKLENQSVQSSTFTWSPTSVDQLNWNNSGKELRGPVFIKSEDEQENEETPSKSWEHECKRLRKKVRKLEARVAALENKFEEKGMVSNERFSDPVERISAPKERVSVSEERMLDVDESQTVLEERVIAPEGSVSVSEINLSDLENLDLSVPNEDKHILQYVSHLNNYDVQEVLVILAHKVFTDEEMRNSSRTGKWTVKCQGGPRPALDAKKLDTLERVVRYKTAIPRELFIKKFENLQKSLRVKAKRKKIVVNETDL